jgi:tetratricopeptide (TPR) repeat protein
LVVDPDQPPAADAEEESPTVVTAPPITTDQLLDYVEYLASLPEVEVRAIPGDMSASFQAEQDATNALTNNNSPRWDARTTHVMAHQLQLPPYEQFVAAYPLTPEGLKTMSSVLAWTYAQAERHDEALRMARAASTLGSSTDLGPLLEINLASIEAIVGKQDAAEKRLRRVVKQEPQDIEDRRASDIRLLAPQKLADLLRDMEKYDEADQLYRELIERALKWEEKFWPEPIGASYAIVGYRGRLQIAVKRERKDGNDVEKVLAEARERMPSAVPELEMELQTMRGLMAPPIGAAVDSQSDALGETNDDENR